MLLMLPPDVCQKARLARDPRFDGKFFTAVKTTGIYCRSICPATPPKEENVTYFPTAIAAANEGYRPCLRCRPDSAPESPAWKGVDTTVERAIELIHQGALQQGNLPELADRLGITDRYLRQLFKQHVGVSPKTYALYRQCLFAKQLLHQTRLPITQVALASGFNSIRRFNDYFQQQLSLTPSQLRKSAQPSNNSIALQLHYRPPYDWQSMLAFLQSRFIPGLEWCDDVSYGRAFQWGNARGTFTVMQGSVNNTLIVTIDVDDVRYLKPITHNIRRIFDTDVDLESVEKVLRPYFSASVFHSGLRLPGTWSLFEAGVRAILGQQVSVAAARKLVSCLVDELGEPYQNYRLFPTPASIAQSSLDFFSMPGARKQTLRNLADHFLQGDNPEDPETWLELKGIGPWTVNYARMRGLSDPDIYLGGDLGVKKAAAMLAPSLNTTFDPEQASPWRSYLTIHLWNQL